MYKNIKERIGVAFLLALEPKYLLFPITKILQYKNAC